MSLILKSNKSLEFNKLSSLVSTPKLEIDFRDGKYRKNGLAVNSLDFLLEKTTLGRSGKYNSYAEWSEVMDYMLRVSIDPTAFKKGMLIEAGFNNLFINSKQPVSQSINILPSLTTAYMLSVTGGGSATLTIDGLIIGVATQFNPVTYFASANIAKSAVITINGVLDYVGFYSSAQAVERITRITTLSTGANYVGDVVRIKQGIINELLTNWTGCIVLKNYIPKDVFDRTKVAAQSGSIVQIKNASQNGIYVARQENGPRRNLLRTKSINESITDLPTDLSNNNTFALNFTKTSAKLAHNGHLSELLTFAEVVPTDILIGCGDTWSSNINNYVEQILLYDRQLTDDELMLITK